MGLRDYIRLPADGRSLKPRQGFKNGWRNWPLRESLTRHPEGHRCETSAR
jgi:hypothetical protein